MRRELLKPRNVGRLPRSCLNRTTRVLKTAISEAADAVGEDGRGRDDLLGCLTMIARTDHKTFAGLLALLLPLDVRAEGTLTAEHEEGEPLTAEQIRAELERRGISRALLADLFAGDDEAEHSSTTLN